MTPINKSNIRAFVKQAGRPFICMPLFRGILACCLAYLLSACGTPPAINGFNAEQWKNDRQGCKNNRTAMIDILNAEKHTLPGTAESDVIALFGKPDRHELRSRNQRFYEYCISPGPECGKAGNAGASSAYEPGMVLRVRFSATNHVTEVTIEKSDK